MLYSSWKINAFSFLFSRDKKEILDCPLVNPQKDKKYTHYHISFLKSVELSADIGM